MLPTDIVRNDRGADVCHKIIKAAVENVKGDPSKGYHYEDVFCNKPVVLDISENRKTCPSCEKRPPVGNVHPRTTNSAGIILTQKELQECGVTEDPSLKAVPKPKAKKTVVAKKAVEAKVKNAKKDSVSIEVDLGTLESAEDIAAVLIRKASDAMDQLPTPTLAESKRLIRIQEKLDSLLKV